MKLGSNNINKLYLGATEVDRLYLGTELIYPLIPSAIDQGNLLFYADADRETGSNGSTITTVRDYKNGNNGIATNITLNIDGSIKYYDYRGVGDSYINLGNPSILNRQPSTQPYSIMMRFKFDASVIGGDGNDSGAFWGKGPNTVTERQYFLTAYNSDTDMYLSNGGESGPKQGTIGIFDTDIHTVILTSDTSQCRVYIDGALSFTTTAGANNGSYTNTIDFLIGARRDVGNTGIGEAFLHRCNKFAFWDSVLSPTEITAIEAVL